MASIVRRLGFGRTNTSQASDTPFESPIFISNSGGSIEKKSGVATAHREDTLEAQRKLKDLAKKHRWDPNLPSDTLEDLDEAAYRSDLQHDSKLVDTFEENSPYPEVRAAVRNVSQIF